MTSLWLLRHGQTDWNLQGRWQGQAPDAPGLNEDGRMQVLTAREELRQIPIDAIYSSNILRALQTAEIMAVKRGLNVIPEPRLREINLGRWEGMLSEDILASYPRELEERIRDPLHARAPGGESPAEVSVRVLAVVEEIVGRHPGREVLIVSHGLSLAIVVCHSRGIPLDEVYEHIPGNAHPYRMEWN